jgi:hypothetical protein
LKRDGAVAIIVGDFPKDPSWQAAWPGFVARWTERLGDKYQPENWRASYAAHETWMDLRVRQTFVHPFSQTVDDFIECQHSRASWARAKLGAKLTAEFDVELRTLVEPFARNGVLSFDVETELMLGDPRSAPLTP